MATPKRKVLCTGAAGYIGSHTVVELIAAGYDVVIVDNLCNASSKCVDRVREITGSTDIVFIELDLLDRAALRKVFAAHQFYAVIHFAGLKAVGESTQKPLQYYYNNVTGSVILLEVMAEFNVKNIVFSSSATVYGNVTPEQMPLKESHPLSAISPYGRTKLMIEEIMTDLHAADPSWNIISLRYFNPTGAHRSGRIGEDPKGIPNNLMPFVSQVAIGRRPFVSVYGGDYPTHDGTGVRDYVHVVDLAQAHVAATERIAGNHGVEVFNIGTGQGYSVLDMIKALGKACGKELPYKIVDRRPGDTAVVFADCSLAEKTLHWKAKLGLEDMCTDLWRWQSNNPNGFE